MSDSILENAISASGTHQFNVGGNVYTIQLLPATKGLVIGTDLIKLAAPVLGLFADNSDDEFALPEEQDLFFQASTVLVNNMDKLDIVEMVQDLLTGMTFNSKTVEFDSHFRGDYGTLLMVLETALKENFGSFLSSYLKVKGIEIPSLRDLIKKDQSQKEQDSE